ncbi:MAG: chromate efflux transporter [Thermonemataceae bacterium]|nr:chromate efflux transporter [Thermonemataceae bacterium]
MNVRKVRYFIFLKEVFLLSWTGFGGPQAHLAMFLKVLVQKRAYLSEEALLEIMALCQILPGPTSTQTITGVAYKVGGASLAYLTLIVWVFPAVLLMTLAALLIIHLQNQAIDLHFARFSQAIAIGFILSAAHQIIDKTIKSKTAIFLMLASAIIAYFYHTQWFLPLLILLGGLVTTTKAQKYPKQKDKNLKIRWRNLSYFILIFLVMGLLSELTRKYSFGLPFRLAENFFRTGSVIFGGGQVLVPLMLTEFVYIKRLVSREEFDLGYNLNQIIPGPTFAFASFIGALAMEKFGVGGQILGAFLGAFGVFMPGTLLIFFVMQFWDELKKYRPIRASLEGINAVSVGLVLTAVILMAEPIFFKENTLIIFVDIMIISLSYILLHFTKISPIFIVLGGFLLGWLW